MQKKQLISFILCFILVSSSNVFAEEKDNSFLFEYKTFNNFKLYLFDSGSGTFDNTLTTKDIKLLTDLWKKARHHFVYGPDDISPECLSNTKATQVLYKYRFLQNHVVFLINQHPPVSQWYETEMPAQNREPCVHTQFMEDALAAIGLDGQCFGYAGYISDNIFSNVMERETIKLKIDDLPEFLDFYFYMISENRIIEGKDVETVADYCDHIEEKELAAEIKSFGNPKYEKLSDTLFTASFFLRKAPVIGLSKPISNIEKWEITISITGLINHKKIHTYEWKDN